MKDDVTALLSSGSFINNNSNNNNVSASQKLANSSFNAFKSEYQSLNQHLQAPSLSSFTSDNIYSTHKQQQQIYEPIQTSNKAMTEFDLKIKLLEEQAKQFRMEDDELSFLNYPTNNYKGRENGFNQKPTSMLASNPNCFTSKSAMNLSDRHSEEVFLNQIK